MREYLRSSLKLLLIELNRLQQKYHISPPTIVRLVPKDNGSCQNSSGCINSVQPIWTTEVSNKWIRTENPEDKIPTLKKDKEKLNTSLELSIKAFKRGLEIQFPAKDLIETNSFVIDENIAKYFYEVNFYYESFEKEFKNKTQSLSE